MSATLSPSPKQQFFDANGAPLVGGKLYSYTAGTTSPLATYVDSAGTTTNTNPIILDSRGEANVWLGANTYKLALYSATDVLIWTVDDITGAATDTLAVLAASGGSNLIGYLPSGTGAVATTVQTKLRETVSVKDFGAVGDGVTDDTAAFTSALSTNLPVFVPSGTYVISSTLNVPTNSALYGAGRQSVVYLKNAVSGSLTGGKWINVASGASIHDLCVDGNLPNNSTTYFDAVSIAATSNALIANLWIQRVYGNGVSTSSATDFVISNINISDISGAAGSPGEGIYCFAAKRGVIANVTGKDINDHLIYIAGATATPTEDIAVSNCSSYNAGRAAIGSSSYNVFGDSRNVSFSNCISDYSKNGLTINANSVDSSCPTNVAINGMTVVNSSGTGIGITGLTGGSSFQLTLSGIKVFNAGRATVGQTAHGILLQDANDFTLTGIDVQNSNDDGVRFARCVRGVWTGGKSFNNSRRTVTPTFNGIRFGDASGTMTAGQVDNIHIVGVSTTDTAAVGKLQKRGFFFEAGSTNCSVSGGNHEGNETAAWSKDASTDASCKVFGLSYTNTNARVPTVLYGTAVPAAFTWGLGDRVINANPAVGNPKSWACTVAGTPGTWVSEGNL